MTDNLQAAIKAADSECPCKSLPLMCCARCNTDAVTCGVGCLWPGHALIRAVSQAAQEGMRERAAEATAVVAGHQYGHAVVIRALPVAGEEESGE